MDVCSSYSMFALLSVEALRWTDTPSKESKINFESEQPENLIYDVWRKSIDTTC
jgi:hypothetical protein